MLAEEGWGTLKSWKTEERCFYIKCDVRTVPPREKKTKGEGSPRAVRTLGNMLRGRCRMNSGQGAG